MYIYIHRTLYIYYMQILQFVSKMDKLFFGDFLRTLIRLRDGEKRKCFCNNAFFWTSEHGTNGSIFFSQAE